MNTNQTVRTATATEAEAGIEKFVRGIDPGSMRDARHLRAVAAARKALQAAEDELRHAVAEARAAGDSWTMIGLMLGTSKQAAHRKFGGSA